MQAQETILNERYRLLEQAGSGGMATVYKAHDLTLRRLVAVKVLHERLTGDETFLRRFPQEAHAAGSRAKDESVQPTRDGASAAPSAANAP